MKLLAYKANTPVAFGIGDKLIRWRLNGNYSHTEIMFEPGDNVEHYVPDGILESTLGWHWCASSTGTDKIPLTSLVRPGATGGCRFKRINPNNGNYDIYDLKAFDPVYAAKKAKELEGKMYDYQLLLGFIAWVIPNKEDRYVCSEFNAEMLGFEEAWRIDPCLLVNIVKRLN